MGCSWAAAAFAFALPCPSHALVSEGKQSQADAHCQKSDNSVAGAQKPWAEQQEPLCLFIWLWHVPEHRSDPAPTPRAPPGLGSQDLDVVAQARRFQGSSLCVSSARRDPQLLLQLVKL